MTAEEEGGGGNTFEVGDTIPGFPFGGTFAFGRSLNLGSEVYTCQSPGGCEIRNGVVARGTIARGGGTPPPPSSTPDLVVESPSVGDSNPSAGASFTLRATVRNRGDGRSAATTLRYYRSSDATISASDTAVGADAVSALSASGTSAESIGLTAPSSAGTYYYGACVDTVSGESNTANNCSNGVRIIVSGGGGGGSGTCVEVNDVIGLGEGESCTITQALVGKYSLNRVSVRAGDMATCSGGRVRLSFANARSINLNGLTIRCR